MGNPQKLRVYLVEDSAIMSPVLRTLIEAVGAKIVGNSGAAPAAIEDIKVLRPDVVIVDIGLREGNGFDVLKALFTETGADSPARIVLTNHAIDPYRKAAKRWGATYFFDKSKQIPEMLRVLRELPRSDGGVGASDVVTPHRARRARAPAKASPRRDRRQGVTTRSRPSSFFRVSVLTVPFAPI